jgi:hypothetical protein
MHSFDDLNSVWMNPIKKCHIKPEEEEYIKTISSTLIDEFSKTIHNFTNIIIFKELSKRPKASLHQQLLIKRQVSSNVSENMKNISINMAKDRYDFTNSLNIDNQTEPELIIDDEIEKRLIIDDEIDMNYEEYDINYNRSFYTFLDDKDDDDDYDMQIDYLEYLNSNYNNLYQPENVDDILVIK